MKFIITYLSLVLVAVVYEANGNPCDGDVFSLGCKMFELIKSNTEKGKVKLDKRFDVINKNHWNDTKAVKLFIADNIDKLSTKEAADMKIVTQLLEGKWKALEELDVKINETNIRLDKITHSIATSVARDVSNMKTNLMQELGKTTSTCKAEVNKFENRIEEHMNVSNEAIEKKMLKIEEEVGKKYVTIEAKLNNKISTTAQSLTKVILNNVYGMYEKGLKDMTNEVQTSIQNISRHNIENEISKLKKNMDTKYKKLKNEINGSIVTVKEDVTKTVEKEVEEKYVTVKDDVKHSINKITDQLKTTIESEMDTQYHSLTKELNDNIAKSTDAIVQDIHAIKHELEDIKEATTKEWPSGHYCVMKYGSCPPGFYYRKYYNVRYCCI